MKKILVSIILGIMALSLVACSQPFFQPASGDEIKSDKPRITSPVVEKEDLLKLTSDNNTFAFDLYQALKSAKGNVFYSPYSISAALAMTYAGARGETEKQMADVLNFMLSQDKLHTSFNALEMELAERGREAQGKDEKPFRLNTVNATWGQKDFHFESQFLDLLAQNYGAGLRILDFQTAPEDSRITINKWVSEKTENRINDLIPQGVIDELTRLVLTNAIYFNAAWEYPFDEKATSSGTFNLLNDNKVNVSMMKQSELFRYAEGNGYQAVELPYDGNELSMLIMLPAGGQFEAFENSLNYQQVAQIIGNLKSNQVNLTMPKFDFESSFSLKKSLAEMGMPIAFTDQADFSGMTGKPNLEIAEVIHKAFVSVDEAGTEAAAATAVVMRTTSMAAEPVTVTIDRPFIFLIRDIETGAILFVGRVVNPSGE